MTIEILRATGKRETLVFASARGAMTAIATAIGAQLLDVVNLRDGRVMLVDDGGYETRTVKTEWGVLLEPVRALKPVNAAATALYLTVCHEGTTHEIVGDVAIALDADFEGPSE